MCGGLLAQGISSGAGHWAHVLELGWVLCLFRLIGMFFFFFFISFALLFLPSIYMYIL